MLLLFVFLPQWYDQSYADPKEAEGVNLRPENPQFLSKYSSQVTKEEKEVQIKLVIFSLGKKKVD